MAKSKQSDCQGPDRRFVDVGEEEFLESFEFTGPMGETFEQLMERYNNSEKTPPVPPGNPTVER